jgi:hypothetical protein
LEKKKSQVSLQGKDERFRYRTEKRTKECARGRLNVGTYGDLSAVPRNEGWPVLVVGRDGPLVGRAERRVVPFDR